VLKSNRQLWAGINTPWWWGCKAWFPERGKTFTIQSTASDRETLRVAEGRNLAAEGIRAGDWFMIYAIEPGVTVSVPGDFAWQREPASPSGAVVDALRATCDVTLTLPTRQGELWLRVGREKWQPLKPAAGAAGDTMTLNLPAAMTAGQVVRLLSGRPAWLKLDDSGPPQITAVAVDGQPQTLAPRIDLGRGATPGQIVVQVADADNPLDPASVAVALDGKPLSPQSWRFALAPADRKSGRLEVDLKAALAPAEEAVPKRHVLTFRVHDFAIDEAATELTVTYVRLVKPAGNAVYLSDRQEESSFVHGGLRKDTNYYGEPLVMNGVAYAKSLQTHVEVSGEGNHSEVIYDLTKLTPARHTFRATVGVSDEAGGGSVTFAVQVQTEPNGPWVTRYQSLTVRGNQEPLGLQVDVSGARKLRLYCTDAGDGISSDHATWAEARLE
jgi:NPCBM/NEW2 domain